MLPLASRYPRRRLDRGVADSDYDGAVEHVGERRAGELRALVGVEDVGLPIAPEHLDYRWIWCLLCYAESVIRTVRLRNAADHSILPN